MKQVTATRERVVQLKEHFSTVSDVTPEKGLAANVDCPHCGKHVEVTADPEPFGKVQTFKWRTAKNAERCKTLAQSFRHDIEKIMADTSELTLFFEEQEALFKRFQKHDADGKPVANNPDGSIAVDETRADEIKAAMVELKAKHAEAMSQYEARDKRLKDYMAETVSLELATVQFLDLPRKISGDWIVAIAEMIDGLPAENDSE